MPVPECRAAQGSARLPIFGLPPTEAFELALAELMAENQIKLSVCPAAAGARLHELPVVARRSKDRGSQVALSAIPPLDNFLRAPSIDTNKCN